VFLLGEIDRSEHKYRKRFSEFILKSGVEHSMHGPIKSILSRSDEPVPRSFISVDFFEGVAVEPRTFVSIENWKKFLPKFFG